MPEAGTLCYPRGCLAGEARLAALEEILDDGEELEGTERLGEIAVGAGGGGLVAV